MLTLRIEIIYKFTLHFFVSKLNRSGYTHVTTKISIHLIDCTNKLGTPKLCYFIPTFSFIINSLHCIHTHTPISRFHCVECNNANSIEMKKKTKHTRISPLAIFRFRYRLELCFVRGNFFLPQFRSLLSVFSVFFFKL